MESINLKNYEAYFLDFVEGNLDPQQVQELSVFINNHPELQEMLDDFELVEIPESNNPMNDLSFLLLREESTQLKLADYLMIAQAEGTISQEEKITLSKLISKDESLIGELAIYHKTILAKEQLVYEYKHKLLQKEEKPVLVFWFGSAAAAVIALFVLFNWNSVNRQYFPETFSYQSAPTSDSEINVSVNAIEKVELKQPKQLSKAAKQIKPIPNLSSPSPNLSETNNSLASRQNIVLVIDTSSTNPIEKTVGLEEIQNDLAKVKNTIIPEKSNPIKSDQEYVPIQQYAKQTIKKGILRDKAISRIILDEIADLTNEKVTVENRKDADGKSQRFAINIGKFAYSNY